MLTGCGNHEKAWPPDDPAQMPGIVFIVDYYYKTLPATQNQYAIRFYDKNGNYYGTDNREVCGMSFEELVKAFENGELDGKITCYSHTCDADELFTNYQKLCEVSKNNELDIVYPQAVSAVEEDLIQWYGLYYDREGEFQQIMIHEDEEESFYTNDKQANEIYEWYEGTFQK